MAINPLPPELEFDAPIPGEGLTSNPDSPQSWERPPEYTDYDEATKYIFDSLMAAPDQAVDLMSQGLPVDTLATQILFSGFSTGKWNPDLMLLLIEPVIYMLIFICEQAGVDYDLTLDDVDVLGDSPMEMGALEYIQRQAANAAQGGAKPMEEVLPGFMEVDGG